MTFRSTIALIALLSPTAVSLVVGDESNVSPRLQVSVAADYSLVSVTGFFDREIAAAKRLTPSQRESVVRVSVISPSGNSAKSSPENTIGLLGEVDIDEQQLTFRPRFPFREGETYVVVADASSLGGREATVRLSFSRAKVSAVPAEVVAVYPSSNRLPENLLKFYLHFSAPMQQGRSYQYLKLIDLDRGDSIEFPFLELGEELWDPTGKRLTVLFDPGRVKQGLKPREVAGPVLQPNRRYRLRISDQWKDARGNRLARSFHKDFVTTSADTIQPAPTNWKIRSPKTATRAPLSIDFPESLDHAMLHRVITVQANGKQVAGTISVERNETRWVFTPNEPWSGSGDVLELQCDTTLEDNAGNSIARAFEVKGGTQKRLDERISIPVR